MKDQGKNPKPKSCDKKYRIVMEIIVTPAEQVCYDEFTLPVLIENKIKEATLLEIRSIDAGEFWEED